jgi:hypothetical protein
VPDFLNPPAARRWRSFPSHCPPMVEIEPGTGAMRNRNEAFRVPKTKAKHRPNPTKPCLAARRFRTPMIRERLAARVTSSLPALWANKTLFTIVGHDQQHESLSYLSPSQAPRNRPPPRHRRAAGARRARLWTDDIESLSPPHQLPGRRTCPAISSSSLGQ